MNIFFLNKKAQASAPFEVLVAVILMGFVILAGTWALNNLSESTCLGNKRQEIGTLKESIKDVVLNSELVTRNFTFNVKPCFNQKYETIAINYYSSSTRCNAFCGGGTSCTLLEYVYKDTKKNITKVPIEPVCLELPTNLEYESNIDYCVPSDEKEDWFILTDTDLSNNIPAGKYRLTMASGSHDYGSSRKICFLRKKKI